jgi:hypothetical protein
VSGCDARFGFGDVASRDDRCARGSAHRVFPYICKCRDLAVLPHVGRGYRASRGSGGDRAVPRRARRRVGGAAARGRAGDRQDHAAAGERQRGAPARRPGAVVRREPIGGAAVLRGADGSARRGRGGSLGAATRAAARGARRGVASLGPGRQRGRPACGGKRGPVGARGAGRAGRGGGRGRRSAMGRSSERPRAGVLRPPTSGRGRATRLAASGGGPCLVGRAPAAEGAGSYRGARHPTAQTGRGRASLA